MNQPAFPILLYSLMLLSALSAHGQSLGSPYRRGPLPVQSIYFEAAGNGIVYSGNYDLTFSDRYGLRLGVMPYPLAHDRDQLYQYEGDPSILLIVMGHRLWGTGPHKLETAGGLLTGEINEPDWKLPRPTGLTFTLGYRYQPDREGGLMFRAGFTPLYSHGRLHPRIGISLGWVFSASSTE